MEAGTASTVVFVNDDPEGFKIPERWSRSRR
jgi:hypothetical protein